MFCRLSSITLIGLLIGCASEPEPMRTGIAPNSRYIPSNTAVSISSSSNTAMVGDPVWAAEAAKWIGSPYRSGGSSRDGMDEAGLIRRMYENAARLRISSGLDELSRTGVAIPREQLRPGDMVFFGNPQINGAGIVLGENRMVTATPTVGVVYAQITDPPFADNYRTARRLLR